MLNEVPVEEAMALAYAKFERPAIEPFWPQLARSFRLVSRVWFLGNHSSWLMVQPALTAGK